MVKKALDKYFSYSKLAFSTFITVTRVSQYTLGVSCIVARFDVA